MSVSGRVRSGSGRLFSRGHRFRSHFIGTLAAMASLGAAVGCSVYPIPDNKLSVNTEDIVRHAHCEMRSAIVDLVIQKGFVGPGAGETQVIDFAKSVAAKSSQAKKNDKGKKPVVLTARERAFQDLMGVSVVYSFDFNITENNTAAAGVGFKMPFTAPSVLDADAGATLNLTRQGQRQFKSGDSWGGLVVRADRCRGVHPRERNLVYPLDGSIGIGRVVRTFIDITEQGGAKDSFVDTLLFTTQVGGSAGASVKLNPVPHSFRVVSASAGLSASRLDAHKMIISLVYPRPSAPAPPGAISGATRFDGYLSAPFDRPPDWRARYNLCVSDAREREDTFKVLREQPPEIYCITYADEFAPQYDRTEAAGGPSSFTRSFDPERGTRSGTTRGVDETGDGLGTLRSNRRRLD